MGYYSDAPWSWNDFSVVEDNSSAGVRFSYAGCRCRSPHKLSPLDSANTGHSAFSARIKRYTPWRHLSDV